MQRSSSPLRLWLMHIDLTFRRQCLLYLELGHVQHRLLILSLELPAGVIVMDASAQHLSDLILLPAPTNKWDCYGFYVTLVPVPYPRGQLWCISGFRTQVMLLSCLIPGYIEHCDIPLQPSPRWCDSPPVWFPLTGVIVTYHWPSTEVILLFASYWVLPTGKMVTYHFAQHQGYITLPHWPCFQKALWHIAGPFT